MAHPCHETFPFQLILSQIHMPFASQSGVFLNWLSIVDISCEVSDKIKLQESGLKTCDSRDIVVADIFVKVMHI